jgi:hypothetical protein
MITILIYIVNYATQGPFNPLMHEEYLKIGEYATLATSFWFIIFLKNQLSRG